MKKPNPSNPTKPSPRHNNIYSQHYIDGVLCNLIPPDLDKDGKIGGAENINTRLNSSIASTQQPTELGDTLKELNSDVIDMDSNMSGIDLRSNLREIEVASLLAFDTLIALEFYPLPTLRLSRQKKRLSVSLNARGRSDIVEITKGERTHQKEKITFTEKIKNFMGVKRNENT